MVMNCKSARSLVPGYLDGELSEAQAAPLRAHLMDCHDCRSVAQEGKALKGWFVDERPWGVPAGFAARVARRAFAGDTGAVYAESPREAEGRVLDFVLQLTAAAAAVLIALSIGISSLERPQSNRMRADDLTFEETMRRLEELNAEEDRKGAPEEQPVDEPAREDDSR